MSANIEALVAKHFNPYAIYGTEHLNHMRNALTEQAEAFKGELQAYDGMVRELTKTVEDMRAAQSVAVVAITGEPIAILRREIGEDTWFDWTPVLPNSKTHKQLKAAGEMDYCEVYQRYTQSITAAELATLRELADAFTAERKARDSIAFEFNKVSRELEALRKEAERWRKANEGGKFCISEWAAISKEWVDMLPETAIERIDAAIAGEK